MRLLFSIALICQATALLADTVILRDGRIIEGSIREMSAVHLTVELPDGRVVTLEKSKVRRIGYGPVKTAPEPRPEVVPPEAPRFDPLGQREDFDFYRLPPPAPLSPPPIPEMRPIEPAGPAPVQPTPFFKEVAPRESPAKTSRPAIQWDGSGLGLELSGGSGRYDSFLPAWESGLERFRFLYARVFYPDGGASPKLRSPWQFPEESRARLKALYSKNGIHAELEGSTGKSRPYYKSVTLPLEGDSRPVFETAKINRLRREDILARFGASFSLAGWTMRPLVGYGHRTIVNRIHSTSLNVSSLQLPGGIPELWDYTSSLDRSQEARLKGPLAAVQLEWKNEPFSLEGGLEYQNFRGDFRSRDRRQVLVVETLQDLLQFDINQKRKPIYYQAFVSEEQSSRLSLSGWVASFTAGWLFAPGRKLFLRLEGMQMIARHSKVRLTESLVTREGTILVASEEDLIRKRLLDSVAAGFMKGTDRHGLLSAGLQFSF
ncbi:MAG: hypothetical protein HS115_07955 [Spirochaetales bacterium]|nr:hypothetical protein [Spirochaetales bacterium]